MQTDPTLLRYASAITEQKKCWEFLAQNFDRFQTKRTTPNNTQQHVIECANDQTCIIQQCCVRLPEAFTPKGLFPYMGYQVCLAQQGIF